MLSMMVEAGGTCDSHFACVEVWWEVKSILSVCLMYPQRGADEVSGQWWQVVTAVHYVSSRHARSKTL